MYFFENDTPSNALFSFLEVNNLQHDVFLCKQKNGGE
jgi:hypothetical protein